jgi:hypothetical protein
MKVNSFDFHLSLTSGKLGALTFDHTDVTIGLSVVQQWERRTLLKTPLSGFSKAVGNGDDSSDEPIQLNKNAPIPPIKFGLSNPNNHIFTSLLIQNYFSPS